MRKSFSIFAAAAFIALFAAGCAGPEQKLGRGINNFHEVFRGGEFQHSVEQSALFDSPDTGYTRGVLHGLNRTIARTGVGLWEIVSFPFPNHDKSYGPVCTNYLSPDSVYPDSYKPGLISDSAFASDGALGFSGGDVAPMIPGSRFRIFDSN